MAVVGVKILGLAGDTVAELDAAGKDTVVELKQHIRSLRPSALVHWQRLLYEHRELHDTETMEEVLGEIREDSFLLCHLIIAVNPNDLLDDVRSRESALCLNDMGCVAAQHLKALFEDDGEPICPEGIQCMLEKLSSKLIWERELFHVKIGLMPHFMCLLTSTAAMALNRQKCTRMLVWLDYTAVPHLVAWLGLLERPVEPHLRSRIDLLRSGSESPRVRVAAKAVLKDVGDKLARVKELSSLYSSLGRDILQLIPRGATWVIEMLEDSRCTASARLVDLRDGAVDCKVRYAAARALKQIGLSR